MTITERFRLAREHAKLSQGALSERCAAQGHSVSRGQIAKLEVGERTNPRGSDTAAIARATGVRLRWLLEEDGPMLEGEPDEAGAFDAARAMFLAQEVHEGRGEEARTFLVTRSATYAGAEGRSPGWWLETLRDEFRTWRTPSKTVGSRELEPDEEARPSKTSSRRG